MDNAIGLSQGSVRAGNTILRLCRFKVIADTGTLGLFVLMLSAES